MGYEKTNRNKKTSSRSGMGTNSVGKYIGKGGRDNSIRQARVARILNIELADIIGDIDIKAKSYPDEDLLRGTSIVDVDLSPDLSYAKVFISVLGNAVEKRQVYVWLCENVGK